SIAGRVIDARSEPVADAKIQIVSEHTFQSLEPSRSKPDGRFEARNLIDGTYTIEASAGSGAEIRIKGIQAGRKDLIVVLPDLGRLVGKIEGFSRLPEIFAIGPSRRRHKASAIQGSRFDI